MKKILLLLLLTNATLYAQFFSCDFESITEKFKGTTDTVVTEIRGSDGCINDVKIEFIIPKLSELDAKSGWGAYYYEYNIKIEGSKRYKGSSGLSSSNEELLYKVVHPVSHADGGYSLSVTISKEIIDNYLRKELDNESWSYSVKPLLYLTKYTSNNDPGNQIFFPCTSDRSVIYPNSIMDVSECLNPNEEWKPDLQFVKSNILIKDGCRLCERYYRIDEHRFVLYDRSESELIFKGISIINSGNSTSLPTSFSVYAYNYLITGGPVSRKIAYGNIPSLLPGKFAEFFPITVTGKDLFSSTRNTLIIFRIDPKNEISEYNENNNEFQIYVDYKTKYHNSWWTDESDPIIWIKPPIYSGEEPITMQKINSKKNKFDLKKYELYIYRFDGSLIKKVIVNPSDEINIINSLPNGMYILNSVNGSRKIGVNNY